MDVAAAALLPGDVSARPHAQHAVRARQENVAWQVSGHPEGVRGMDVAELFARTEKLHGASARAVEGGAQLGVFGGRGRGSQAPEVDFLAFPRGGERLRLGERALSAHGFSGLALADAPSGGSDVLQLRGRRGRAGAARHERGGGDDGTDG